MNNRKYNLNIIKLLIILVIIITGLIVIYFYDNLVELLLGIFLLIIGIIILFFFMVKSKKRGEYSKNLEYDERSDINRLKASDLSFKVLFVSINIVFVINALNWIPADVLIALLGPISAFSIILYLSLFYWTEKGTN